MHIQPTVRVWTNGHWRTAKPLRAVVSRLDQRRRQFKEDLDNPPRGTDDALIM